MKHVVGTKETWGAYRLWWCNTRKFFNLKGHSVDVKIKLENKHTETQTHKQLHIYVLFVFLLFSMKLCQK